MTERLRRITSFLVLGLFLLMGMLAVPRTMALLTALTSHAGNTFGSTALYSPSGLAASWTGSSSVLSWTAAPGNGNGNGYLVSGMNNGASAACPASAAAYTTVVGSTSAVNFTDNSSPLLGGATWTYLCYLVQSGYSPAGPAPWGGAPAWTSVNTLATVALQIGIVHIQNTCLVGAPGTTLTATFAKAVQVGDLLVGVFRANTAQTVTDNVNGAWTQANINGTVALWYLQNSKAAAAGVLKVTVTAGSSGGIRICADEFSGIAATSALDTSTNSATATSPWVATATPAVPAGELVFAGLGSATNNLTLTAGTTNGAAMTMGGQQTTAANGTVGGEYRLSAVAGAQNSSISLNPSTAASGVQGTFRPTGSPIPKGLLQQGPDVVNGAGGNVTGTLPAPSTAGNLLVAVVNNSGASGMAAPAGWVRAIGLSGAGGSGTEEIWYYANNPGGISTAGFTSAGAWSMAQLSEWRGFATVSPLDQTGSQSDPTGASSVTVSTAGALASSGELAVTGHATAAAVTSFNAGAGWSSLANDPGNGILNDYRLNLPSGAAASETASAVGAPGAWAVVIATFK